MAMKRKHIDDMTAALYKNLALSNLYNYIVDDNVKKFYEEFNIDSAFVPYKAKLHRYRMTLRRQ